MKKLPVYMSKYWYRYLIGIACLVTTVSLDNRLPLIYKDIVDNVIVAGMIDTLPSLLIAIAIIGVITAITQYFKEFVFDMTGCDIANDIRRDLFNHVQSLSLSFFDKTSTGELMARIKNDCDTVWGGVGFIAMLFAEMILTMGLVLYHMYTLNPLLAILPTVFIPVCIFMAFFLEKKLDNVYSDISEENAKLNTIAEEDIAGVRTVKAFAREKFEIKRFLAHNQAYYDLNMKQAKTMIKYQPLFTFFVSLMPLSTIILGGKMVMDGDMKLGTLTAFISYCSMLNWPLTDIAWCANEFASTFASWKKIKKIAAEQPNIVNPAVPAVLPEVKGHITFDNVSFSVGDKEILKNISFDLPEGKTLGVMGATGSGKTSLITMLFRFYDPVDGSIRLDGTDIKELSLNQLRGSISQVSQDVFLFSDTVDANVKFGLRNKLSQAEVKEALKRASAEGFVEHLEHQGDTVIGERGVGLSGGQKQRISIARALAKNAPVLVLDDSTSALDTETEQEIQKVISDVDCTKIIIGHRISAVRHADEIIVLSDGAIKERGTHDELLALHGLYYETYVTQMGIKESEVTVKEA